MRRLRRLTALGRSRPWGEPNTARRQRQGDEMTVTPMMDVLIIGAGQAGLALGYYLRQTPLRLQLVERNKRIGESWRRRYEALELFTPRAYSALPGLALADDPDGYAGKDE